MPNGDFARYRWIVDSCLETHNNVNQPAGYLRCNGEKSLATVKQLDDLYGAFIKQLRWDVDSMLSVWHNVLGIKPKPFAWSLAAGIGGEAYGVMGAGFNLVAVEIAASCKAEFPQSHPDTGATSMFVCECLWKWLARQNLDQGVLPDLVCGGVPCGGYSTVPFLGARSSKERWVKQLRVHLERMTENLKKNRAHGMVWWLENVPQAAADMVHPTCICGAALGLPLFRHRLFDSNFGVAEVVCRHAGMCVSTKSPYRQSKRVVVRGNSGCKCGGNTYQLFGAHSGGLMGSLFDHQKALGMDWGTNLAQLHQCIPPVYGLYMGRFALQRLICLRQGL